MLLTAAMMIPAISAAQECRGWKMTGPFLVASEGPVTMDPLFCASVDDQKWSCTWQGAGDTGHEGPQAIIVRFDQEFSDSVECFMDEEAGLPIELIAVSVD